MWNLEDENISYNLFESDNSDDNITYVEYHKFNPNLFIYSSTQGYFDYCDLRVSS